MAFQQVIISGNVGQDPESRFLADGTAVTNFSVAVQDGKDHTEWFRVCAFRQQADVVRDYVNKGDRILVSGRLKTREYEKNGTKQKATELIADRVDLQGGKRRQEASEDI